VFLRFCRFCQFLHFSRPAPTEFKVVEYGPDILSNIVAIGVADSYCRVGHLPGRLRECLDGHLLGVVGPVLEGGAHHQQTNQKPNEDHDDPKGALQSGPGREPVLKPMACGVCTVIC